MRLREQAPWRISFHNISRRLETTMMITPEVSHPRILLRLLEHFGQ
jgi:hypothetical protein